MVGAEMQHLQDAAQQIFQAEGMVSQEVFPVLQTQAKQDDPFT